jgi:hypothetical protein
MAVNKNDMAILTAMIKDIPEEWSLMMPQNMMTYFAGHMVVHIGYAKTVDYLRDMADGIEKCGMELDGRKTWK